MESHYRRTPNFSVVRQMLGIGHFCDEDLFQGCPARPHHPRVWGFLLPADRTPSVIKSLNRLRGTVDTVSAHHQITGAACQRGTAELA